MDYELTDVNEKDMMNETMEGKKHNINIDVFGKQDLDSLKNDVNIESTKREVEQPNVGVGNEEVTEVNMEAAITADDVIRAGGFGARDDINSLLPAATDSTDFEASLLHARDYEEPQGKISRPGLGWIEPKDAE